MKNKIMTQAEFMANWKKGKEMMDQVGPIKTTERILNAMRGISEHNPDISPEDLYKQLGHAICQILQENQNVFFGTSIKKVDINTGVSS